MPCRIASGAPSIAAAEHSASPARSTFRARRRGAPVFVQAGASTDGRAFAARYAEAIFTAHLTKESAISFYADVKTQARTLGRSPDQIVDPARPQRCDRLDRGQRQSGSGRS